MVKKGKSDDIAEALLSTMMAVQLKRSISCLSFVALMKARKMNDRNTPWRKEWRNLIEEGYIQPKSAGGGAIFTSDYKLTDKGEARAGSPEQKEIKRLMEATVNTTAERLAQIRKLCRNRRSVQTVDLLLKHGSMTRKEIALMIEISDRGAPFSYGLRHLKELGYIVEDTQNSQRGNKKLMLSDKAFMNPKDRPKAIPIDPITMSDKIRKREEIYAAWLAKNPNQGAAVKKEATKALQKEDSDEEDSSSGKEETKSTVRVKTEDGQTQPSANKPPARDGTEIQAPSSGQPKGRMKKPIESSPSRPKPESKPTHGLYYDDSSVNEVSGSDVED